MGYIMSENDELKKQLEVIQNQLIEMRREIRGGRKDILETHIATNEAIVAVNKLGATTLKNLVSDMKLSDFNLYWSIFFSAVIGVLGNLCVSLWFQPATPDIVFSFILTGFGLVIPIVYLGIQMLRALRKI